MNGINSIFEYMRFEKGSDTESFKGINSGIYFWYFPIILKTKNSTINEAIDHLFNNDIDDIYKSQVVEINDKKLLIKANFTLIKRKPSIKEFSIGNASVEEIIKANFTKLVYSTSIINKPIYIGKATREADGIYNRLTEHIKTRTDFSRYFNEDFKDRYTLSQMIIGVIDIGKINEELFFGQLANDIDLAEELEKILIKLFRPIYNSKI